MRPQRSAKLWLLHNKKGGTHRNAAPLAAADDDAAAE
jgi:hypothetical protein